MRTRLLFKSARAFPAFKLSNSEFELAASCRGWPTRCSNGRLQGELEKAGSLVSMAAVEPSSPLQTIIMLRLDTRPSTDLAPLDAEETRLESAVRIALRIVQQKASPPCFSWYVVAFSLISTEVIDTEYPL